MDFPEPDNLFEDRKDVVCELVKLLRQGHILRLDVTEIHSDKTCVLTVDDKDFHHGILGSDLTWAIDQGYLASDGRVLSLGANVNKLQCELIQPADSPRSI